MLLKEKTLLARDEARKATKQKMYERSTTLISLCLTLCFVFFFYFTSQIGQEASLLMLWLPILIQIKIGQVNRQMFNRSFLAVSPFLISVGISYLVNFASDSQDATSGLLQLLNLIFFFFASSVFAAWEDQHMWRGVMNRLAILLPPIFMFVLLTQQSSYYLGRWMPYFTGDVSGAHPNWWGSMALTLGWSALCSRRLTIKIFGLLLDVYFMYLLQARGALVALIVAFLICSGYVFPLSLKRFSIYVGLGTCVILGSFFAEHGPLEFIADKVFLVSDPERGAGTGLSGRTEGYAIALDSILESPIFGKGIGTFSFVHNGFILICAESGLLGLLSVLYMLFLSTYRYGKVKHRTGAGYLISYVILLQTYPRLFNANMTAVLTAMIIARGLALGKIPKPVSYPKLSLRKSVT